MRPKNLLFVALTLPFFGLGGCAETGTTPQAREHVYFDVPGFVAQQQEVLESTQPVLEKTVGIRHTKPETRTVSEPNWNEELTLFREIDLNKKALEGLYAEALTQTSEGQKLVYTRKPGANAPFVLVEISRTQEQQVTALRAIYEQKNGLFFSREERILQANPAGKLQAYQVSGVQKVLFFDSLHYAINSRLP